MKTFIQDLIDRIEYGDISRDEIISKLEHIKDELDEI